MLFNIKRGEEVIVVAKPNVKVVSGDIAKIEVDALITAINSKEEWHGGIDYVIKGVAGDLFHDKAIAAKPLYHGQAIVARSYGNPHNGAFTNVVFVVDTLKGRLSGVIYNGLVAASKAGFKSVSIPTIRMGVMLGEVEDTIEEAVNEIVIGIERFIANSLDTKLKDITLVVLYDPRIEKLLRDSF